MRVGIIGLGSIGKRHAANASEMGHVVVGCDPREVDIPITQVRTVDTLVVFQPDALMICTPANTHAHIALELRDLGYAGPLFCEKPLALSVDECRVFREWGNQTTFVGYNLRFHPKVAEIKATNPTRGDLTVGCDNAKYGNDAYELSHELDLAFYLGAPARIDAFSWLGGYIFQLGKWCVQLNGLEPKYYRRWRVDTLEKPVEFPDPKDLGTEMYRAELAHFLECVEQNKPTITPFADGIRVVEICAEAMKMAGAQA